MPMTILFSVENSIFFEKMNILASNNDNIHILSMRNNLNMNLVVRFELFELFFYYGETMTIECFIVRILKMAKKCIIGLMIDNMM